MRRFFLSTTLAPEIQIQGEDVHHISRVLRLTEGDIISVVGQDGQVGLAKIVTIAPESVTLSLCQILEQQTEPSIKVALAQGLPKGDKMEYIVQKAVELGVSTIIPVATEHSVVRYDHAKKLDRVKRWQKIAVEAAKQCGRTVVPSIAPIQDLTEVLSHTTADTAIIMLYEGETPQGLKKLLNSCDASSYLLLIGPEGGFSPAEVEVCQKSKANVVTMGPRILRTETASLAALAAVMYHCGDLGGMTMAFVAFTTLGCKVNQFETEAMSGLFKARGYQVVAFDQFADIYVINTCSVTHLGEKKSRQLIRRAIRTNPKAMVAVTGCYAQVSPEEVAAIEGVHVIIGTQDRDRIVDLVEEASNSQQTVNVVHSIMATEIFEDIPLFDAPGRTRAFLKIQEGCTNFCTYCIIPYARGPLRSRPLDSVINEATKLIAAGFKEIVLTGIHLGAYGREGDKEITLVDAVRAILGIEGLVRLRLSSLESIEISDELIHVMKLDSKLCRHLHLPLQAGDDTVLAAMNRHYTTQEYRELIEKIRHEIPDVAISTDIIVGFPGETETMFESALAFVKSMEFSKVHIFPYSKRQGTPAATYPNQIPEDVKKQRVQRMQSVADQQTSLFQARFIGQQMEILFEGDKQGIVEGLASNSIRVFSHATRPDMRTLEQVQLEKNYQDGLWGTIIE